MKLQKIIWNKRSDSNVGDETALEFTICPTQTCDVEKEWTIHSLDPIVKANFQLNKKVEMLVYQHFYLLLIHFEQIRSIILRSCP
ncbi:hypothetical protein [Lysinibacillus fusiformis]|uniref:hypothetical protein n=1 Tax=Lysinibacillus fusiformis TaxID=28031 RepID=UPI003016CA65